MALILQKVGPLDIETGGDNEAFVCGAVSLA